jgi:pyruvate/2-oxoglutarate dehydrogenase complex dihydrolipoamide dehydrogenase (E3) component
VLVDHGQFWHAPTDSHGGDLLFIQGHSSPGIYARAFLEGRLSEDQLLNYRQETGRKGISSYPHPWLMPDFWQLPSVSMGLGPLMAIYQARFLKYLQGRGLAKTTPRKLWALAAAGGGKRVIKFAKATIAAGSQAVKLPFMPDDERVVDSTGALSLLLKSIPKRMLVICGGIIGLEMATVYSTLGTRIDVVEMPDGLMQGPDRDLVKVWEKMNAHRFGHIMLKTKTVGAKATKAGIEVAFEGENAPKEPQLYALVLGAVRRSPNGKKLIFDEATHRVIGGGIVGTHAGDLIGEVCLAIEMGCGPTDIGKTIHPHPPLGESIGMAAEVFEGHCTDLPPVKKK